MPKILSVWPPGAVAGETVTLTGHNLELVTSFSMGGGPPLPVQPGFSPQTGAPGTSVVISGMLLDQAAFVVFYPMTGAAFALNPDGTLSATVPAGASTGPIQVCSFSACAATASAFVVDGSGGPAITGFTPDSGPAGTAIAISGSNLAGVTTVSFTGGAESPANLGPDGRLYTTVPLGAQTGPITLVGPVLVTSAMSFTVQ